GGVGRQPAIRVVRREHVDRAAIRVRVLSLGPEDRIGLQRAHTVRCLDSDHPRDISVPPAELIAHTPDNTPVPAPATRRNLRRRGVEPGSVRDEDLDVDFPSARPRLTRRPVTGRFAGSWARRTRSAVIYP